MGKQEDNITEVYNYVNHSLTFVEAKNGVMVALCGGVIMGIFSLWEKWIPFGAIWFFLAFVPASAALAFSLTSFYPLKQKRVSEPAKEIEQEDVNLFRCESIAGMPLAQLIRIFALDMAPDFVEKQKVSYIQKTSVIVAHKYRLFRAALWCFCGYGLYFPAFLVVLLTRQLS